MISIPPSMSITLNYTISISIQTSIHSTLNKSSHPLHLRDYPASPHSAMTSQPPKHLQLHITFPPSSLTSPIQSLTRTYTCTTGRCRTIISKKLTMIPSSSVDSTDTPYRYAAYANRIRTILLSAHRYVAYTSDIGESFRPIAHPILVRSAYAISWAYLLGDVSHEGYKAYLRNRRALVAPGEEYKDAVSSVSQEIRGMAMGNLSSPLDSSAKANSGGNELSPWPNTREVSLAEDYRMVMAKRAVFQSLASMGLPAFTIHSVVKYSGKMVRGVKVPFVRTWVPIGVSLSSTSTKKKKCILGLITDRCLAWSFGRSILTIYLRSPS